MSESLYDDEIAPALMKIGARCEELGLPMVAVVEYAPDKRGETRVLPEGAGLAMRLLTILTATGDNLDSFYLHVARYCKENGISTDASIVMRLSEQPAAPSAEGERAPQWRVDAEVYAFINAHPLVASLLYDLELLPEQLTKGTLSWGRMLMVCAHFYRALSAASAAQPQPAEAVRELSAECERLRTALELILPLATGYAAEHPAKINDACVEQAENALESQP